jgi:hypothetical protein
VGCVPRADREAVKLPEPLLLLLGASLGLGTPILVRLCVPEVLPQREAVGVGVWVALPLLPGPLPVLLPLLLPVPLH